MARVQTRKSVSVRGVTYRVLRVHCAAAGVSMSDYVEALIAADFEARGQAEALQGSHRLRAPAARPPAQVAPALPPSAAAWVTLQCAHCDNPFERKRSQVNEHNFCSVKCRVEAGRAVRHARPSWKRPVRPAAAPPVAAIPAVEARPGPRPAADVVGSRALPDPWSYR